MPSQIQLAAQARGRPGSSLLAVRRSQSPQSPGSSLNGNLFNLSLLAFKETPINGMDRRCEIRQTSESKRTGPNPIRIDIDNLNTDEFKLKIAELAETQHTGFKKLFIAANESGMVDYFGYVANSSTFPKIKPRKINEDDDFEQFKRTVGYSKGKQMGIIANMIDPHGKARKDVLSGRANNFDHAMLADDPEADPVRGGELDFRGPAQDNLTKLHQRYGDSQKGDREAMMCYSIDDPLKSMKLDNHMLKVWADAIMDGEPGVSLHRPPIGEGRRGFQWTKSDRVPGIFVPPVLDPLARAARTPAPYGYPGLDDYFVYCNIAPEDQMTRNAIEAIGIVDFDEFLSKENSIEVLKAHGMKHGPAVRLSTKALGYWDHLKMEFRNHANRLI